MSSLGRVLEIRRAVATLNQSLHENEEQNFFTLNVSGRPRFRVLGDDSEERYGRIFHRGPNIEGQFSLTGLRTIAYKFGTDISDSHPWHSFVYYLVDTGSECYGFDATPEGLNKIAHDLGHHSLECWSISGD